MSPRAIRLPLPVDPDLPDNFDQTPNEDRSSAELDAWWDQPFLVTNGDGTYTARCLNGGAWDRSTFLGAGVTVEEATRIALAAQARVLSLRQRPVPSYVDGVTWDLVLMPQRPDKEPTVLQRGLSTDEVRRRTAEFAVLGV